MNDEGREYKTFCCTMLVHFSFSAAVGDHHLIFLMMLVFVVWVLVNYLDTCSGEKFFSLKKLHHPTTKSNIAAVVGALCAVDILSCKLANAMDMEINQSSKLESISVDAASTMILSLCSKTVEAARFTGRILYRGEGEETESSNLEQCKLVYIENLTDLTVEGTYTSNPLAAADYFSSLDRALFSIYTNSLSEKSNDLQQLLSYGPGSLPYIAEQSIRLKYGHLATSDIQAASVWGVPVSVWPVDEGFHYAWLRTLSEWWQDDWTRATNAPRTKVTWQRPYFWRSPQLLREFINSEVKRDVALETALYTGKEVLFSSGISPGSSPLKRHLSYITVPLSYEPALLRKLQIAPFDSKAKVSFSKPMDLDGDAVRRRRIPDPLSY